MPSDMDKHHLSVRDYNARDRAACLALFDGNTPDFFAPEERDEYGRFLDHLPAPLESGLDLAQTASRSR
jgi:hypothetical protein